jgi:CheY-like chemotaxis protein
VLKNQGYHVLEAASGMEALSLWDQHNGEIDMLLTDVVMPDGLNGRDLAARLRSNRGNLPVLLVSGYSPNDLNLKDELEGSLFLPKPYTPQRLIETVRRCLDEVAVLA